MPQITGMYFKSLHIELYSKPRDSADVGSPSPFGEGWGEAPKYVLRADLKCHKLPGLAFIVLWKL